MPVRKAANKKKKKSSKKVAQSKAKSLSARKKPIKKKAPSKAAKSKKKSSNKKTRSGAKKTALKKSKVSKKKTKTKKSLKKKSQHKTKATSSGKTNKKLSKRPGKRSSSKPKTNLLTGPIRGFKHYKPKRGEAYMSNAQLKHFKILLQAWKQELINEVDRTVLHMKDDAANFPDPNDRATQESEFGLELRTRDRERKLLRKINSALLRIEEGNYGYCEETGDEIGLRRLEARPVATLCVEAQERRELAERQFRDRDDRYR